jgi:hypothetical protein
MRPIRRPVLLALAGLLALSGCGKGGGQHGAGSGGSGEPKTVDVPQNVSAEVPGTTPMAQRVAVLGFLNKRNGIAQELTLHPGQAARVGDAIVRLRACEATASWEAQKLTGAFVQLDVKEPRDAKDRYRRVFSGWLYKETPSLNVVEHSVYDVWPKSCAMKRPGDDEAAAPPAAASASNRSSAPKSPSRAAAAAANVGGIVPAPPPTPARSPATAVDNRAR